MDRALKPCDPSIYVLILRTGQLGALVEYTRDWRGTILSVIRARLFLLLLTFTLLNLCSAIPRNVIIACLEIA